jgi:hypothetical protein
LRDSSIQRIRPGWAPDIPAAHSALPAPDPRLWPDYIRTWWREATGACSPLDIFIFDFGANACLYLQDAITAAATMEIDASEWHIDDGYPVFIFEAGKLPAIQRQLGSMGYNVRILVPGERPPDSGKRTRAKVLNIAIGFAKREGALLS